MSRWKDTLCGKAIPVNLMGAEGLKEDSQVLSCGGAFLPRPAQKQARRRPIENFLVYLPKDHYEVIVTNSYESRRYGLEELATAEDYGVSDEVFLASDSKI